MNLSSSRIIKNLLKKYGARPSRRFGQNFLVDKGAVGRIIKAAELKKGDTVLEIGPGTGTLTQELAKRVKKVAAVEKDREMTRVLKGTLKDFKNVEIFQGNILNFKNWGLKIKNSYKVVANLPFYITSPVIRHFLEAVEMKPQQMVLVVQKEVGQRICARPPRMSILAVSVQLYAEAKIISYIPKRNFWPRPKVDAAIISIRPKPGLGRLKPGLRRTFFEVVKAGFSQPRKQLANNLSKKLNLNKSTVEKWLSKNRIRPSQRAETLSVEDWINLTRSFKMN